MQAHRCLLPLDFLVSQQDREQLETPGDSDEGMHTLIWVQRYQEFALVERESAGMEILYDSKSSSSNMYLELLLVSWCKQNWRASSKP